MTNKHQQSRSVDDYLRDGWIPIADTRLGITYEKAASQWSLGTFVSAIILVLWALFGAVISLEMSLGIALIGFILLGIYDHTRPPERMLILHESKPVVATDED